MNASILKQSLALLALTLYLRMGYCEQPTSKYLPDSQFGLESINYSSTGRGPVGKLNKCQGDLSNENHLCRSELSVLNVTGEDTFDFCDLFFHQIDDLHGKFTISEVGNIALSTKHKSSVYSDLLIHKYDNFNELKVSGGPKANQDLCVDQLEQLITRANQQIIEGLLSSDLNIFRLLDTYGRVPAGLMLGNAFWPGVHDECVRLKIDTQQGLVGTRYCVASLRHKFWPKRLKSDLEVLKMGVCLPESCDSMAYKDKYSLIQKLIEYQARDVDKNQAVMVDLYCLPDDQSPIRSWLQVPKTLAVVTAFALWISCIGYCTYKYESLLNERSKRVAEVPEETFGLSSGLEMSSKCDNTTTRTDSNTHFKIYRTLAATYNFRQLINTTKKSSLMEMSAKVRTSSDSQDHQVTSEARNPIVDIHIIEGIKVICMFYVITGHVLMLSTIIMSNGRDLSQTNIPAYVMANLTPAFAVNAFFSITGLLTSYLLFTQSKSHSFLMNPYKWIAFIFYRYMRIMPMYLIVVLFSKTIAKHLGSGPFWDYATSAHSSRRACEQESILWTVLFAANFKNPIDHCIPSAWYLANDFQFFLLTPIFMIALHKNPTIGKRLIKGCILVCYLIGVYEIATVESENLSPITMFKPHGFKTYLKNLAFSYTRPHHRIPAYLCGILVGYSLFCFEQKKMESQRKKTDRESTKNDASEAAKNELVEESGWPKWYTTYGTYMCLTFVIITLITPSIAKRLPDYSELGAKLTLAVYLPTFHIVFSLAVGLYILLATTGHGNRFLNNILSASIWKPLARLSLCVVLVNIEVISYYIQSSKHPQFVSNRFYINLNAISIAGSYFVALIVCVLFEAPIRGGLNQLLSHMVSKVGVKSKSS